LVTKGPCLGAGISSFLFPWSERTQSCARDLPCLSVSMAVLAADHGYLFLLGFAPLPPRGPLGKRPPPFPFNPGRTLFPPPLDGAGDQPSPFVLRTLAWRPASPLFLSFAHSQLCARPRAWSPFFSYRRLCGNCLALFFFSPSFKSLFWNPSRFGPPPFFPSLEGPGDAQGQRSPFFFFPPFLAPKPDPLMVYPLSPAGLLIDLTPIFPPSPPPPPQGTKEQRISVEIDASPLFFWLDRVPALFLPLLPGHHARGSSVLRRGETPPPPPLPTRPPRTYNFSFFSLRGAVVFFFPSLAMRHQWVSPFSLFSVMPSLFIWCFGRKFSFSFSLFPPFARLRHRGPFLPFRYRGPIAVSDPLFPPFPFHPGAEPQAAAPPADLFHANERGGRPFFPLFPSRAPFRLPEKFSFLLPSAMKTAGPPGKLVAGINVTLSLLFFGRGHEGEVMGPFRPTWRDISFCIITQVLFFFLSSLPAFSP